MIHEVFLVDLALPHKFKVACWLSVCSWSLSDPVAPNIAFGGMGEGYDTNQNERTGHLTWMVVILSDPGINMFFLKF